MYTFLEQPSLQGALATLGIDYRSLSIFPVLSPEAQVVVDQIVEYEKQEKAAQEQALTQEEKFKHLRAWPVEKDAAELLYLLACHLKPQRVLECGTSFGLSTIYLASGLKLHHAGQLITVEVSKLKHAQATENFEKAGMREYICQEKMALDHYLKSAQGFFDLVFLDCDRSRYSYYLDHLRPHLKVGSYIIADNVADRAADIAPYRHKVEADMSFSSVFLDIGDGLLLSKVLATL